VTGNQVQFNQSNLFETATSTAYGEFHTTAGARVLVYRSCFSSLAGSWGPFEGAGGTFTVIDSYFERFTAAQQSSGCIVTLDNVRVGVVATLLFTIGEGVPECPPVPPTATPLETLLATATAPLTSTPKATATPCMGGDIGGVFAAPRVGVLSGGWLSLSGLFLGFLERWCVIF
jgi:hypothetical protein